MIDTLDDQLPRGENFNQANPATAGATPPPLGLASVDGQLASLAQYRTLGNLRGERRPVSLWMNDLLDERLHLTKS